MDEILGYDCDGNEIYEYMILHAIWANDIDIEELKDADPREYCAVLANDGNAYAISVNDFKNGILIEKREHLNANEEIPVIVKPISEMENYEIATCNGVQRELDSCLGRLSLKDQLNMIIYKKSCHKKLVRRINN